MKGDHLDPKALIQEAYQIDGIGLPECRSIFMDWALSMPSGTDTKAALTDLLTRYSPDNGDHPMTVVLTEGLAQPKATGRRGGWRARRS